MQYFGTAKETTLQADGYDVSHDHYLVFGNIEPDWSSYMVDTVKVKKKTIVEYSFQVMAEYAVRTVHSDYPKPVTSAQIFEYGVPVKTELVFKCSKDVIEYMALRCTVFKNHDDTVDFKTGLIVDVDPFSNQMMSFWSYESGRVTMEYLWLNSPAHNPYYSSHMDRNTAISHPKVQPNKKKTEWSAIHTQLRQYKYYSRRNKSWLKSTT